MKRGTRPSKAELARLNSMISPYQGPGWTENPVDVTGNSVEDVKKSLMLMLHDIDKHGVKEYNGTTGGNDE